MKGILNFLARANLIELSDDERLAAAEAEQAAADTQSYAAEPASAADMPVETGDASPPELATVGAPAEQLAGRQEGIPLPDIYAAAAVPASPYAAEKLLRLLDGLRAMDAGTRHAAVLAMDAADDNWQIVDCVRDAQFKISALGAYKEQLTGQLQNGEQQAAEVIDQIKLSLDKSSVAIRQQITELEQLLEREVTRAAQETTRVEAGLRAARESSTRETRRMDAEIERLREIPNNFKAPDSAAH
ncbi:methyl-accepting chemotaxis protein [Candidatus Accumulibacter phosphatis]|jgi:hypothetical protein|uniref:Methyl-accepting chemotaxis protein n=1 Tax=Candidatus Accumulibacter phosphatis TaxID=327160 RepID=A0ABX1U1W9_9PROT|nr:MULTISPECIES: methyl-accepting chemotaxis protein [Candidatus Accumulibacter]NMQ29104.1 methyl-accepting chemotaxis protein [Candidatus Accumulibacter phosphatis]